MLSEGLAALGLPADSIRQARLLEFLNLMGKWNRIYNLTAIASPQDRVRLHLLDSLAILPHLQGERVLDVGTGAGLPGIPLAIYSPTHRFTLLDSNSKKTRFVQQAAIELGLRNVQVVHSRIEQFRDAEGYDVVLARAYASLADIVRQTGSLLKPGGTILAQKGKLPASEIAELTGWDVEGQALAVPGVEAERHLIKIRNRG
ncbi:16S rRNA (guanine(527)-N(7))-methyltransferase RsmG [Methylococcus sp. EFPC2]|nr:16S rRNA (guanine(527)-N(7))-methyltransferase RsmG [Methylococcus sp. EFPC2]